MKTIIITGVSSGIGKALITHFTQKGERVIGISRNREKLNNVLNVLDETYPNHHTSMMTCDFSSFRDMKRTVENIKTMFKEGIDILINNAAIVPKDKKFTVDDFEMQFQVNHLAVAYFTESLKDLIIKKSGRVITTSSDAHKRARFDATDLEALSKYHSFRSYCRTKLYNVLYTNYLKTLHENENITFLAVHPGRVKTEIGTKDTAFIYKVFWKFFTRKGFLPNEVVGTYDYLVYENQLPDSNYFYQSKPLSISEAAEDEINQSFLYEETRKLIKPYL
ncbi:MAG: SDR family NAD(P)-dependent oxidoreductase [Candidatus Izemoplasmataceae bacterium]